MKLLILVELFQLVVLGNIPCNAIGAIKDPLFPLL
jgi:hypothetical protein